MTYTMIKALDFLILGLYFLFIFFLSDQSSLPAPIWFEYQDKLYHAGAYFIMALLIWRAIRHYFRTPIIVVFASIIFCSLYGLSDEWHQTFVVGRSPDILDWVADTVGATLAMLFLTFLSRITKKKELI
ncbi:MAG: VanZ family protein [Methylococcales bacterium]